MDLNELLGIDLTNPLYDLAGRLVDADTALADALRARRIDLGLSIDEVAERMGVHPQTVADIETNNLGAVRRYALAVGVLIEHTITNVIEEP
jgi:DNA-binding XRE family transcriptional regulator